MQGHSSLHHYFLVLFHIEQCQPQKEERKYIKTVVYS